MIFDPLNLHRPPTWTPESTEESFEFRATFDPINEDRDKAANRIHQEYKRALRLRLDRSYGADDEGEE